MAKLKIYTFPEIVLATKANPILRVEKERHYAFADDMLETMYDAPGIGLAANQVGVLERLIVVDTEYDYEEIEPGSSLEELESDAIEVAGGVIRNRNPIILINPEIVYREGKTAISEGCLSVPDYSAEVDRSKIIQVEYQTIDGVKRKLDAEGLLAICIQHEIDHLDGKLFIDRLSPLKQEMVKKKLKAGKIPPSKKKSGIF